MAKKTVTYKLERYKYPDEKANNQKRVQIVLGFILAVMVAFGAGMYGSTVLSGNRTGMVDPKIEQFTKVYELMKNHWYFGKDIDSLDSELINDAINGMMQSDIDLHTYYMTREESMKFSASMSGSLTGVGVQYYAINGDFIIDKVYHDSPAQIAGLMPGDLFYEVDGTLVHGISSNEIQALVRGKKGSNVDITVLRQGEKVKYTIMRDVVLTSVYGEVVAPGIGLVQISSFADTTGKEMETYLKQFKEQKVTKLIVDLRGDGGGYLTTVEELGNLMFPSGTVMLQQEHRDGKISLVKTTGKTPYLFDKMAVLVDGQTASAAEVFAAACKETLGATLFGEKTYGKGTVQIPQPFTDGSVLKYTVAQWLTKDGEKINGIGIMPDAVIEEKQVLNFGSVSILEPLQFDSVAGEVAVAQNILRFIGYETNREDGYFNMDTKKAMTAYQKDNKLEANGILNQETMNRLLASNVAYWFNHRLELDVVHNTALEWLEE